MDSYMPPNRPEDTRLANPWYVMRNWAHWVGSPISNWNYSPVTDQPDVPSLIGAGLESFADPEFAEDFLQECCYMDQWPGPDEYRRLSANWKDRSKADAFVALAVAQYESDNRSLSPIDFENGVPASADRFLAW